MLLSGSLCDSFHVHFWYLITNCIFAPHTVFHEPREKNYVYKFAITRKVVPEKVLEWPNIDTQPMKWNVQWLQWYIHNRTIGHVWPHPRAINIRASLGILCVVVTAVDIFKTRSMNRTARLSIWLIYMVCVNAHTLRSGQCSVVLASYCCVFAYGVVVN